MFLLGPLCATCFARSMKGLLGIDNLESSLATLIALGEAHLRAAAVGRSFTHCMREPSRIKRISSNIQLTGTGLILAIDIGGTSVKASVADFRRDHPNTWHVLFQRENAELLDTGDGALPLGVFAKNLAHAVNEALQRRALQPHEVGSISLVWSNQVQTAPLTLDTTRGVTGFVTGIEAGSYRKNEWFIQGLHDGFDLGTLFLSAFADVGCTPQVFLLGNDTVFTLTALPGAHGGVVASSGGNCTDIGTLGSESDHIFNTELGGLCKVPTELLSDGDLALAHRSGAAIALEDLMSGKWLPLLLDEHLKLLATRPREESHALAASLVENSEHFTTRDIRAILLDDELRPELQSILPHGGRERALVRLIASALTIRGGIAAGALCYFSVFNQLCEHPFAPLISLDSAMARHLPGYFDAVKRTFTTLIKKHAVEGQIVLMRPKQLSDGHEISVPLIGATLAGATWK